MTSKQSQIFPEGGSPVVPLVPEVPVVPVVPVVAVEHMLSFAHVVTLGKKMPLTFKQISSSHTKHSVVFKQHARAIVPCASAGNSVARKTIHSKTPRNTCELNVIIFLKGGLPKKNG